MSFIPEITTSYDTTTRKISVTDTSLWGAPNPELAAITKAVLIVYKDDKFDAPFISDIDVTTEVKAGTLTDFEIPNLLVENDGVFIIHLAVNTTGYSGTEYQYVSFGATEFIFINTEEDISKFWVRHACASNTERKKGLYDVCNWLEVNMAGLQSLAERKKRAEYTDTLRSIQRKIELNKTYLR